MDDVKEPAIVDQPTVVAAKDTTTKFSTDSFGKPTPVWAKNAFIIFYSMNTSILGWFCYTHLFTQPQLYEIVGLFKFVIDPLSYILSKMWGVTPIEQAKG